MVSARFSVEFLLTTCHPCPTFSQSICACSLANLSPKHHLRYRWKKNGKHGDIMESNEHMGFMQKNTWDLTSFFHKNVGMEWDHGDISHVFDCPVNSGQLWWSRFPRKWPPNAGFWWILTHFCIVYWCLLGAVLGKEPQHDFWMVFSMTYGTGNKNTF